MDGRSSRLWRSQELIFVQQAGCDGGCSMPAQPLSNHTRTSLAGGDHDRGDAFFNIQAFLSTDSVACCDLILGGGHFADAMEGAHIPITNNQ